MEFTEFCRKELLPGVCSVSVNRKSSHILRFTPSESDKRSPSSLKESITTADSEPIMLSNFSKSPKHYSTNYLPNFDKSFETLISSIKRDFSRSCQNLPVTSSPEETHEELESLSSSKNIEDFYEHTKNCLELLDKFKKTPDYNPQRNNEINSMTVEVPFLREMKITGKRVAIFDLDETLMHRKLKNIENTENIISIHLPSNKEVKVGINLRPHLFKSLQKIKKYYYLIAFTASQQAYADAVLNLIDPKKEIFSMRLYRHNCTQVKIENETIYIKDLRILRGINLKDVVIIDNSILSFAYQLDNGIPIVPYLEGKEDDELLFLSSFLINIAHEKDLREKINSQIVKIYHDLE